MPWPLPHSLRFQARWPIFLIKFKFSFLARWPVFILKFKFSFSASDPFSFLNSIFHFQQGDPFFFLISTFHFQLGDPFSSLYSSFHLIFVSEVLLGICLEYIYLYYLSRVFKIWICSETRSNLEVHFCLRILFIF